MPTLSHGIDARLVDPQNLVNDQTTSQYDDSVRANANRTNVTAKQYDSSQTTRQPSMKVISTIEGSK